MTVDVNCGHILHIICLCLFITAITAVTKPCCNLSNEVEALKRQGQEQAELLMKQGKLLEHLQTIVVTQTLKMETQQAVIDDYEQRLQSLERVITDVQNGADLEVEEGNGELTNDTHRASAIVKRRTAGVKNHARLALNSQPTVAFHATIKSGRVLNHLTVDQRIFFPDVLLNLGDSYHNEHGHFVAPHRGLYLFSLSIMSKVTDHYKVVAHLIKNGNVLANAHAQGDSTRHNQGSVTVVTQLAAGDEVWVSLYGPAGTSLWGDYFDSFMGCLIVPM